MAVHLKTTRKGAGKYLVESIDACRNCRGSGTVDGDFCQVCAGQGRVKISKDITVEIEPMTPITPNK